MVVEHTGDGVGRVLHLGIDLGWTTGSTGLALVDDAGRLVASGCVRTDDEIDEWVGQHPGHVAVAAVDGPLIVPNPDGQRYAERLISQAFGAFGASAHSSNQQRFPGGDTRALRLARRFGWSVDPDDRPTSDAGVCIEVYPHPALICLFQLPFRLDYKKGPIQRRRAGLHSLMRRLESVPGLDVTATAGWSRMTSTLANPRPGDLQQVEDELDAVVCAHLAWLWSYEKESLQVYGNLARGYIVAPPPPTYLAERPKHLGGEPGDETAPVAFEHWVTGRPTGYAGGENERNWKTAVRQAFSGENLPADARAQVDLEFVLGDDQQGRREPDLDNLIKSTIDALEGVLGVRTGTGVRIEADDVRIDGITAVKRHARPEERPGARVTVRQL